NKCKTEVVFNPAPAPENGLPEEVWAAVDHLVLNETEAEIMAPKDIPAEAGEVGSQSRREKIAEYYHRVGVRFFIVTLGSAGLWYSATDPGSNSSDARVSHHIPANKVEKVVDTTAAGDTFVGAYAVRVAEMVSKRQTKVAELSVQERQEWYGPTTKASLERATKASAICVQRHGAMDSIPWMSELP
ncbi:hypothetical protein KEM55_007926, partial [Ascosphaera atra]